MKKVPRAMTVAGSDSGAGAGIQADLKTFSRFGVYGTTAITAITAQNTLGVQAVYTLPPRVVAAQIDSILSDIGADAVKTGMLSCAAIIEVLAERINKWQIANLVVDPVMVAASGDALLDREAVEALKKLLLPRALIVTPNLPEAEALSGIKLTEDQGGLEEALRRLAALGPRWVLLKGGHFGGAESVDVLFDGHTARRYSARRVDIRNPHGTGCTLAAALTACLVLGLDVPEAVARAKRYISSALAASYPVGGGYPPVNNLPRPEEI